MGYKGIALKLLEAAKVEIGSNVKITSDRKTFEGILIPRYELADDEHIVIKLRNGYNIGIKVTSIAKLEKIGEGPKPAFVSPPIPTDKPRLPTVSIISTGGTIASRIDYRTGAVHSALSAHDLYSVVPELSEIANVETKILFSLFSENIRAIHWSKLAEEIVTCIEDGVRGVVVCHGTDTMAYTSAALSFALQNLPIPIILVGSQRSSDRPSSDAAVNLTNAVTSAVSIPIAEVMVGMHDSVSDTSTVLHRGTKTRKCHTSRRDAFKSINVSPLAKIEEKNISILTEEYVKRDPKRKLVLNSKFEEKVALVKFYAGFNPEIIDWYVNEDYYGLVLEGTGLGHVGNNLFSHIRDAVNHGLLVGMTSQCIWGRVNMNVYDTGIDLQEIGVIPLEDMLPETALVKMMWVFGQTKNVHKAQRLLKTNIANEFSKRTIYL
ncbi:MAG: Glu-tRNA(Gln) amidotransferase subunit GatD [Candidatus Bathyarchaeota archaeon]|nr:MAG: Glu-tRNA(Gln) amidotransferase subunit GatD [Candidatus Bathyarchaeota archaeon]